MESFEQTLRDWIAAWNRHDLAAVMAFFHEGATFVDWHGKRVTGKARIRRLWQPWFANHGDFHFILEDLFVDAARQKALLRWQLVWSSPGKASRGQRERRQGVDVLTFRDGLIVQKLTYSQTRVKIDERQLPQQDI